MANEERGYDTCFGVWDWDWEGRDVVSYVVWVCCMAKGRLCYYGTKGIVILSSKEDSSRVSTSKTAIAFVYFLAFYGTGIFSDLRVHSLGNTCLDFRFANHSPASRLHTRAFAYIGRKLAPVLAWSYTCLALYLLGYTIAHPFSGTDKAHKIADSRDS